MDRCLPLDCPYEWEIFTGDVTLLEEDDWRFGRALLVHPGHSKIIDGDVIDSIPGFDDKFFPTLKFHDSFADAANSVLAEVKRKYLSKQKIKGKSKKSGSEDFIFVGIHSRATDHIEYEKDKGFVPLKTAYYLDAMHMFRQHFK